MEIENLSVGEERSISVDVYAEPPEPGTWNSPGYDAYVEITEAWWEDGTELTDEEFNRLEEKLKDAALERLMELPDPSDKIDY